MYRLYILLIAMFLTAAHSCTLNKAKINDQLKKNFDEAGVTGSFSLLNNQSGDITVYNMSIDTQRVSPGTSFKVISTLIGLETGAITDEEMLVSPDNNVNDSSQNLGTDLKKAFSAPEENYFQEIARKIGRDTMQLWIDSLQYGNKKIGADISAFWLDNSLKITPDEQLGLMFQLFFDKLPFSKYAQQIVKHLMLAESNEKYRYHYATGTGVGENQRKTGWVIGWVEENRHVYFFSTYLVAGAQDLDMEKTGKDITRTILSEMGFFKGQK